MSLWVDLDGMEGDVHHIPIRPVLGHLDPVPHRDHVVLGELNAGHQGEDGVPEDQEDDGRQPSQPSQEYRGVLVQEEGDHQDGRSDVENDGDDLEVALDGSALCIRAGGIDVVDGQEKGIGRHHHQQHHEGERDPLGHLGDRHRKAWHQHRAVVDHRSRSHMGQASEDPTLLEGVVPREPSPGNDPGDAPEEETLGHKVRQPGDQEHRTDPQCGLCQGVSGHPGCEWFGYIHDELPARYGACTAFTSLK